MPHCPMCEMMKGRLDSMGIQYIVCMDTDTMIARGIKHVPVIEDEEGNMYFGKDAMTYINDHYAKEDSDVRR